MTTPEPRSGDPHALLDRYAEVRSATEGLAAPLSPEDQTVQSMPDVSPTKWHRAHVTWFFETFVLAENEPGFEPFQDTYWFLFNSYYETVGPRYARAERGVISRPGAHDVGVYRGNVDDRMRDLLDRLDEGSLTKAADTIELGFHHEQQHQELLLMDIKHVLSLNPLRPAYAGSPSAVGRRPTGSAGSTSRAAWSRSATRARASASTTSCPATSSTSRRTGSPTGWSPTASGSSSWPTAATAATSSGSPTAGRGSTPRAGTRRSTGPSSTASGSSTPSTAPGRSTPASRSATSASTRPRPTRPGPASGSPARRSGSTPRRAIVTGAPDGLGQPRRRRRPSTRAPPAPATGGLRQMYGDCWEWTSSAYHPYPGFHPPAGAIGEYNGKFMSNQMVLRGGCAFTPAGHARATYRNFFPHGVALGAVGRPPGRGARWQPVSRTHVSVLLAARARPRTALVQDVRRGLGSQPLTLPPKWLYDDEGSRLFDEITRLPEYYPTEAERAILRDRADRDRGPLRRDHPGRARQRHQRQDPAAARCVRRRRASSSGSCRSTSPRAPCATPPSRSPRRTTGCTVEAIVGDFTLHLAHLPRDDRKLVAFLGGTIGNLYVEERRAFLGALADSCEPGDWLLLGTDLVKDADRLIAAYDDPGGVTEKFVRNGLRVLNRDLGADFDIGGLHLRALLGPPPAPDGPPTARRDHRWTCTIPGAGIDLHLASGEEIRMEISTKFTRGQHPRGARRGRLRGRRAPGPTRAATSR